MIDIENGDEWELCSFRIYFWDFPIYLVVSHSLQFLFSGVYKMMTLTEKEREKFVHFYFYYVYWYFTCENSIKHLLVNHYNKWRKLEIAWKPYQVTIIKKY